MMSNRDRLVQFYKQHNPTKMGEVDRILEEFRGRENELFEVLTQKYNSPAKESIASPLPHPQVPPTLERPHRTNGSETVADIARMYAVSEDDVRALNPALPPTRPIAAGTVLKIPTRPQDTVRAFSDLMDATVGKRPGRGALDVLATADTAFRELIAEVCTSLKTERLSIEQQRRDLDKERQEMYAALEVARSELTSRETRVERQEQQLSDLAHSLKQAQDNGVARLQGDLDRFLHGNVDLLRPHTTSPPRPSRAAPVTGLRAAPLTPRGADQSRGSYGDGSGVDVAPKVQQARDPITAALRTAKANDVVCLQPGVYSDNIILDKTVEIRGMGSRKEDVVIEASDSSLPVLEIHGGTVTLSNLTLRQRQGGDGHCLSGLGRSEIKLKNVLLCDGNGGVVTGDEANCVLNDCAVRRCTFAALFARDSSYLVAERTTVSESEVGFRVRDATFLARSCIISDSGTDGVVLHGTARGILEGNTIQRSKGNGVVLSARSETMLSQNIVTENQKWGVWCPSQAQCTLSDNDITDNRMGNVSNGL